MQEQLHSSHRATAQVAYTLAQFAKLFNKSRSWSYRLVAGKKVKTIEGYGCKLIPASEVERITGFKVDGGEF